MRKEWFLAFGLAAAIMLAAGPAPAGGDAAKGSKIYAKKCKSCHSVKAGQHKMGPSLAGIFGSKAGATDFKKYKGFKDSDIVWDEANLDGFLANPRKFLGRKTTMIIRLNGAERRADVIAYLKTLK